MDANEKNLQTAIRYDVATFETSELLSKFIHGTNLYWCKNYYGSLSVHTLLEVRLLCEKHGKGYLTVLCEAPQARDIAKLLPEFIAIKGENLYKWFRHNALSYSHLFETEIQNHHFSEAYGKLAIALQEQGLLEKGGAND
jgi:hypothetical protein